MPLAPFRLGRRVSSIAASAMAALLLAVAGLTLGSASAAGAASPAGPDLVTGSAYLVAKANLVDGHYYESFPRYADFGLTMDGAFALAATGDQDAALARIVAFLAAGGKDLSGKTVNSWTGIGTATASGGAIGKEALLAEVVGQNPRAFGGRDLIAALDATICARASGGAAGRCPAAGSYAYVSSVFDQALGVMAQRRAGQRATRPVGYLERLQHADGSFPSLIPGDGQDVDSTAMAAMALALVPGPAAAARVTSCLTWIARQQERDGGFPGTGGDSVNSAGLALQALTLRASRYRRQVAAARHFLASEQNSDGGFNDDAGGQPASDVRASTQAVGGAVGVPLGTVHRSLGGLAAPTGSGAAATSQAGRALPMRDCTATSGVILAVDFARWDGPVLRSCGSTPTTGFALLNQGGWSTAGDEHDGPGFICRIGYDGFHSGTQYPTPRTEACVLTPPASAYWTYWEAGPGQDTWSYNQAGAMSVHPAAGSVNLWVFGGTSIAGTSGSAVPGITPDALRAATSTAAGAAGAPRIVNAAPMLANRPAGHGSPVPAITALVIVAVLGVAGVAVARRRKATVRG